ncbi:GNAT family N-acetyltransferase [Pseudooceanicola sp. HF7]|uniref:GNAT family N-acetyltransferase n=1 Tax=Pseudooceanicola sp. HF7 TaxID=2721560 RepID=UPI001430739F|nr:GNAT family N-acetyltransferase [Pseudooceanicola sp. HF7]NIZ08808.1 GNAT family N-acetyltransferase [Pseudooceanicola sp. HF7]
MLSLKKGRYAARFAETAQDLQAAQQLRARAFFGPSGTEAAEAGKDTTYDARLDADDFDQICTHVLVEDQRDGRLVCCFRILPLSAGREIGRSYSAQYYELSGLEAFDGPMVEMGRFCMDPECRDPDILRIAWAAMTAYVDENGVEMLFGCSSFKGTDAEAYLDAFAMLKERHLAPKRFLPRVKAPSVFRFAQKLRRKPDLKRAALAMPPLLRTYLLMGGWVSDHAVVDARMNTLHVFTGLEIRAIPPARKRLLRTAAG